MHVPSHLQVDPRSGCSRIRLAESSVARVELCECGIVQLHIGALTLRLAAPAMSELLGTLGAAVAAHAALLASAASPFVGPARGGHGQA